MYKTKIVTKRGIKKANREVEQESYDKTEKAGKPAKKSANTL